MKVSSMNSDTLHAQPRFRKRSFSLVEVLVGAAVTLLMIGALYTFFSGLHRHFSRGTALLELEKDSRLVMERLKTDIRAACTRGSVRLDAPAETPFYKIIAEDPDLATFGEPRESFTGEIDYIHGYTLKFFKFASPGSAFSPPTSSLITWTSSKFTDDNGRSWQVVQRVEEREGQVSATYPLKIPDKPTNNVYLYFVVFTVDEITPELVRLGKATNKELGTGGRTYVRVHFMVSQVIRGKTRMMELVTVMNPRQINLFDQDPYWKQNSHTMVEISSDLLPSK